VIDNRHLFTHVPLHFEYGSLDCVTLEEYRYYVTPEGKKFPSITTCLGEYKKEILENWRKRVGEEEANKVSTKACDRGTGLHNTIERYILNKPPEPPNPWVHGNFLQIQPYLDKYLSDIYAVEQNMYSDYLGCSGTSDAIAKWDGIPSIIDWKSSAREKGKDIIESYFVQGTFYSIALEERIGLRVPQIVIVIACDDTPAPLVFKEDRKNWYKQCVEVIGSYVETYPDRFDKGKIF